MSSLDPKFKFEIASKPDGKSLMKCFQCGICASSCPYSETLDVKPNQVLKMAILGLREKVLSCRTIWVCSTCFMCVERCPQGVELTKVMFAIKNIAARERGLPEGVKPVVEALMEKGILLDITKLQQKRRLDLKLPATPKINAEFVKQVLTEVGAHELLKRREAK